MSTQVNTTVYARTIDALVPMAKLVQELGVSLWSVFYLVPTGRAQQSMIPSASAVECSLKELTHIAARAPVLRIDELRPEVEVFVGLMRAHEIAEGMLFQDAMAATA